MTIAQHPPPRYEEIDPQFLATIQEKYQVLDIFCMNNYDYKFDQLRERLLSVRKDRFDPKDRIMIVQFDSDYYVHNQHGINLANLFTVWRSVDIPLYTMLFYTNNMGLKKEIDFICRYDDQHDRPGVIETLINPQNYSPATYDHEPDLDVDQIQYHGMAMMGAPRSHRFALYNALKDLSDQLVLTLRAPR